MQAACAVHDWLVSLNEYGDVPIPHPWPWPPPLGSLYAAHTNAARDRTELSKTCLVFI